jgi:hypothetical protein
MTRRRLLAASALLLLPLIGFGVYLLIPPNPGVTVENFHRLHKGMMLEQVETLLGGPENNRPSKFFTACISLGKERMRCHHLLR